MKQKIITIAQQKGGAGKSTLAAHLAVALMQKKQRVAIIDIDPQASLAMWYREREKFYGEDQTSIGFHSVTGWRISSETLRLRHEYDVIIVDSPPHMETETKAAIRAADLVLIPVQPSPTDVWATEATLKLVAREKVEARIIMNRVLPNSRLAKEYSQRLPYVMRASLGNRVAYAAALMDGRTVTETDPTSTAATEMRALANEVWHIFTNKLLKAVS